ncbi:MAG: hypothetical protein AAF572_16340 [Cyanobacteria bacterium P01_B01_bin.77]
MKLKLLSTLLGAISLLAMPLTRHVQAEEAACPTKYDGIELSETQRTELLTLQEELDTQITEILATSEADSPESEEKLAQLEEEFDSQVAALLSPEQEEQVGQLDAWAEEQMATIAPELLTAEADPALTPDQEAALDSLEEQYDQYFQSLLTPEQQQQVGLIEEEFDAEVDASGLGPSAEQEASIEMAEATFEQDVMALLTDEQHQQIDNNLAACAESIPEAESESVPEVEPEAAPDSVSEPTEKF